MCWQSLELFRGQEAECACAVSTLDLARPCCATGPATAATHGANRFLKSVSGSGSSVTGEGKGDSLTAAQPGWCGTWDTGSGRHRCDSRPWGVRALGLCNVSVWPPTSDAKCRRQLTKCSEWNPHISQDSVISLGSTSSVIDKKLKTVAVK